MKKNNKPLISIIIPVYNAEKTLDRCLAPILGTKSRIEVLCINDGSTDESEHILSKFAAMDKRLCVFSQINAGAAEARNLGLKYATGEYIMFCDADDQYLDGTVDRIVADIQHEKVDDLVFHRQTLRCDGNLQHWGSADEFRRIDCDWAYYWNCVYYSRRHGGGVVNKVYKRDLIQQHNISFGTGLLFGEDIWFNLTYTRFANSFFEDYKAIYQQYETMGSICQSSRTDFYEQNIVCLNMFENEFPDQAKEIEQFICRFHFQTADRAIMRELWKVDPIGVSNRVFDDAVLKSRLQKLLMFCESDSEQKKIRLILNQNLRGYRFYFLFLPKLKSRIKHMIGR